MKLLQSQKNELFKLIELKDHLSPNQFNLIGPINSRATEISLRNSDYCFKIFEREDYHKSFFVNYIPGLDVFKEMSGDLNWNGIVEHFRLWLTNLSRELVEPNLWDRLTIEIANSNFENILDNSKLTVREYEELTNKIEILSKNVSLIPLLLEQQIGITENLKRLVEIAKDLGKYDWMNLFVGTIISIVIQLNVTHENANALWLLIKSTFNSSFLEK